jgi:hypothetical protein
MRIKKSEPDHYFEHPPYRVTCSCSATSIVAYNPTKGEYEAAEPGWKFDFDLARGWYCGGDGHTKLGSVKLGRDFKDDPDDLDCVADEPTRVRHVE